jgi:hypothetical protein
MKLIGEHNGFKVYFDCTNQVYNVYKDEKFLIKKYCYTDVKNYL